MSHSIFAPSSMARIVQCPGSVAMSALFPEPDDEPAALEGTATHEVFAEIAYGKPVAVGQIMSNGVVVDDEMLDGAEMMSGAVADGGWTIEQTTRIPRVHPLCFGTPDAWKWVVPRGRLRVLDLKFGHGFVEPYENWQLMAYAAGLIGEEHGENIIVELTIVQPRNYHRDGPIRTWTTTAVALRPYIDIMASACAQAEQANAPTHVGPECEFCPGRHACPTLQRAALNVADLTGQATPLSLTPSQAGAELRRLDRADELLKARRTGLQQQVLSALRQGVNVPHWHIEHGEGRENWVDPAQALVIGSLMGIPLSKPVEPVTPAQARKLGVDVSGFTRRLTGQAQLVADDPLKARKVFG